jgi:hypothetical protein
LLRFSQPVSKEKREFYLKEIGDDLGCLRAFLPPDEFFAKIKQIVLDKSRSGKERAGPLWQFILSPPLKAEPAFIDSLLSPEFPTEVRELALLIAAHYSKPAKVPEAVLQLRSDPDDRIRYRVYECMGMLWQESYWKQFAEGLQDKAPSVVKECAVRLGVKDGRRSIPLLVAFLESAITRDAAWEEARLAACEQIVRIAQNCKIPSQPVYPEPATRPKEFSLLWAQSILAWWKACGAAEFGR